MERFSEGRSIPKSKKSRGNDRRLFLITLGVGIGIGVVFMTIVGFGLWGLRYVCVYGIDCPPAQAIMVVPPTEVMAPIYPTCEPIIVTATPSPTATQDISATATAACATFNEQFPGTPCPSPPTP